MRFVPKTNERKSPQRVRPGLASNGPFQPPVLARLPEIKSQTEPCDEPGEDLQASKRSFRLDNAHTMAEQATNLDAADLSPQMPVVPLAEPPQIVSELPPLPVTESANVFAENAAKIMAETEFTTASPAATIAAGLAAISNMEPASPVDPIDNRPASVSRRIDPGTASPVAMRMKSTNEKVAEKRQAVRSHGGPELAALDSPWHDWIVKLGGTFIAGLLLLMAYQSWQPSDLTVDVGLGQQPEIEAIERGSLRVATAPVTREPGTLNLMDSIPTSAPSTQTLAPTEPAQTPVFVDPAQVASVLDEPTTTAPIVDDVVVTEPAAKSAAVDPLPNAAVVLEPFHAPSTSVEPIAMEPGSTGFSNTATRSLEMPILDSITSDLMPAPVSNNAMLNGPAAKPTAPVDDRIAPVRDSSTGGYPETGYAALNRVKSERTSMQRPEATLTPHPDFSLFPKPETGERKPPAQAAAVPRWKPLAENPNPSPAVKLNGTIQQFSR